MLLWFWLKIAHDTSASDLCWWYFLISLSLLLSFVSEGLLNSWQQHNTQLSKHTQNTQNVVKMCVTDAVTAALVRWWLSLLIKGCGFLSVTVFTSCAQEDYIQSIISSEQCKMVVLSLSSSPPVLSRPLFLHILLLLKTEVVRLLPECWITMLVKSDSVLLHAYNSPVSSSAQRPLCYPESQWSTNVWRWNLTLTCPRPNSQPLEILFRCVLFCILGMCFAATVHVH